MSLHSRKGKDVRAEIFGYVVEAPSKRRGLPKLEHVACSVRGLDTYLMLAASIVAIAQFVTGEVQGMPSHISYILLLRVYHIYNRSLLRHLDIKTQEVRSAIDGATPSVRGTSCTSYRSRRGRGRCAPPSWAFRLNCERPSSLLSAREARQETSRCSTSREGR